MPLRVVFVALLLVGYVAAHAAKVRAAEEFPYLAYINADEVNVRSGPGDNYYPVLKLNRGETVEVYRHDPGGWYAVRPPKGSYSWVAAEFIKPTDGNRGVIIGERVVARVGSVFADVRDVIQVRLDRGEEVEIIEAKRFNSGPGAQTWYKIVAPAGEFRWVSGKYVDRELTSPPPREKSPRNNLILARIDRQPRSDADDFIRPESQSESVYERRERAKPRRDESPADDALVDDGIIPRDAIKRQPADFDEAVDELDLELSTIVAQEPGNWNFEDLRRSANRLLARSNTAVERGRVRTLLSKIDRFDDISQRYANVMDVRATTDRRNRELQGPGRTALQRSIADEPRYDGVGKLAQVVSKKVGTPQYALLDQTGAVRYYITAAPGVNLRAYLGRDVGINGTLGYLPDEQAQHVTAKRIVTVDMTGDSMTKWR
jgi:hypothetical protein